jgi:acylphosphatase
MNEIIAIFSGRVQGVGFRATVWKHASSYGLRGTVQNLPNGDVEVRAQGSRERLDQFLLAIRREPGCAEIDSVSTHPTTPSRSYPDFQILIDN